MTVYLRTKTLIRTFTFWVKNLFTTGNTQQEELSIAMTKNMHKKLKSEAESNSRSFNNEILIRLTKSLYEDEFYKKQKIKGE